MRFHNASCRMHPCVDLCSDKPGSAKSMAGLSPRSRMHRSIKESATHGVFTRMQRLQRLIQYRCELGFLNGSIYSLSEGMRTMSHGNVNDKNTGDKAGETSGSKSKATKPALDFTALEPMVLMSASPGDFNEIDGTNDFDMLDGTVGADLMQGFGDDDLLMGNEGDDRIFGGDGMDTLMGDAGNDELFGGAGSDFLIGGEGSDTLLGEEGADTFELEGADIVDGGDGIDKIDLANATESVTVDLTLGTATGGGMDAQINDVEAIIGSSHQDTYKFSSPAEGDRFFVLGTFGSPTIDLSQFNQSELTIQDGLITGPAGSGTFELYFADVNEIVFKDGVANLSGASDIWPTDAKVAFDGYLNIDGIEIDPSEPTDEGDEGGGSGMTDPDSDPFDLGDSDSSTPPELELRDKAFTADEDATITDNVLTNQPLADGQTFSVTGILTPPQHGHVTIDPNGQFIYTPTSNFTGVDRFEFEVTDEAGATTSAEIVLNVLPVNDIPQAGNEQYNLNANTPLVGNVLTNDVDVDGDTLVVDRVLTSPANGQVELGADGQFTYTPDEDFVGTDSFQYLIDDGNGGTSIGTVTLEVEAPQPVFVDTGEEVPVPAEQIMSIDMQAGATQNLDLTIPEGFDAADVEFRISGLPAGTTLTNGLDLGDGAWRVRGDEISGLQLQIADEIAGEFQLVIDTSIRVDRYQLVDDLDLAESAWTIADGVTNATSAGDGLLGPFSGTSGEQGVFRTFEVPGDVKSVVVEFDFYEIDSWDGEHFMVFANDQLVSSDPFYHAENGRGQQSFGNDGDRAFTRASSDEHLLRSGWSDQVHRYRIVADVVDGEVKIGFGSTLDQTARDESWAIDNLVISENLSVLHVADLNVRPQLAADIIDAELLGNLADGDARLVLDSNVSPTQRITDITVDGLPDGVTLNVGTVNSDGSVSLSANDLDDIYLSGSADQDFVVRVRTNYTELHTIYQDDFESDAGGWSANTTQSGSQQLGTFLGRFSEAFDGADAEDAIVEKTFAMPAEVDEVILEFDEIQLDGWDDNVFTLYINGEAVQAEELFNSMRLNEHGEVELARLTQSSEALGFGASDDQKTHYVVRIQTDGRPLTIGFGANLDDALKHESWGVDNVRISYLRQGNELDSLLAQAQPAPEEAANLVVNGSFEVFTNATEASWGNATQSVAGWALESGTHFESHKPRADVDAADGDYAMDMSSDNVTISQQIEGVEDGQPYVLSFDLADSPENTTDGVKVYWNGELVADIADQDGAMTRFEFTVTGGSGDGSNTLTFEGAGAEDGLGVALDNVSIVEGQLDLFDEPVVSTGNGGTPIDLNINLDDVSTVEGTTATIVGVPADAILSEGVANEDGTWSVAIADLNDLSVRTSTHFSGDLALEVQVEAVLPNAAQPTTLSGTVNLTVAESADPENYIANGSFEDLTGLTKRNFGYVGSEANGWTLDEGPRLEVHLPSELRGNEAAADGDVMLDMDATPGNIAVSQQVLGLEDGQVYDLSFKTANSQEFELNGEMLDTATNGLNVYWNGEQVYEIKPGSGTEFDTHNLNVRAGSGDGSNTLALQGTGEADNVGLVVDDVRLVDSENLLVNGSFENTTGMTDKSWGHKAQNIQGWTLEEENGTDVDAFEVVDSGVRDVDASAGEHWLDMGGTPSNVMISQQVPGVEDGQTYKLTFDLADSANDATDGLEVIWNGEVIGNIDRQDASMDQFTFDVTGGSGDATNTLKFRGTGDVNNVGVSLDNVMLQKAQPTDTVNSDGERVVEYTDTVEIDGRIGRIDVQRDGDNVIVRSVDTGQVTRLHAVNSIQFENEVLDLTNEQIGGQDDDALVGDGQADMLAGGAGDDVLESGDGDDILTGGSGDDMLVGGAGDDRLHGGSGADRDSDHDTLDGGEGDDFLDGNDGDDNLKGGSGDDILFGGNGNDSVLGGEGDDILHGNGGSDVIDGGAGDDIAVFGKFSKYEVTTDGDQVLVTNLANGEVDTLSGIETVQFSDGKVINVGTSGFGVKLGMNLPADLQAPSVTVSGLPSGAVLTAGTNNGDGTWTLNAEQLEAAELRTPTAFAGNLDLSSTITGQQPDGTEFQQQKSISFTLLAADDPTNLIANGSFENTGDTTIQDNQWAKVKELGGWQLDSGRSVEVADSGHRGVEATDGDNWIDMAAASDDVTLSQEVIGLEDGMVYELTFDTMTTAGFDDNGLKVYWNGELIQDINSVSASHSVTVRAGSGDGSNKLTFVGTGEDYDTVGMSLDNVRMVASDNLLVTSFFEDVDDSTETLADQGEASHEWKMSNFLAMAEQVETDETQSGTEVTGEDDTEGTSANSSISQHVPAVEDGQSYVLGFDVADSQYFESQDDGFKVIWNGEVIGEIAGQETSMDRFEFEVTGGVGDGSNTLTFEATGDVEKVALTLDDVSLNGGSLDVVKLEVAGEELDIQAGTPTTLGLQNADQFDPETTSVTIIGVPQDAILSNGSRNDDDTWSVPVDQLDGLSMRTPNTFAGEVDLKVSVEQVTPAENGTELHRVQTLRMNVTVSESADPENYIANGSFEDLTGLTKRNFGYVGSEANGWTLDEGPRLEVHLPSELRGNEAAADGDVMLDMDATPGNIAVSQQVLGLEDGQVYDLSFKTANSQEFELNGEMLDTATNGLNVYWNGEQVYEIKPGSGTEFDTHNLNVRAGSGDGSNTLALQGTGEADNVGLVVDDVRLVDSENLLVNGSFENTTGMTDKSWGHEAQNMQGWTLEGNGTDDNRFEVHKPRGGVTASEGDYWLDMGGSPSNVMISQQVPGVEDGETYKLTFDLADSAHDATDGLEVIWNGEVIGNIDRQDASMDQFTFDVTGGSGDATNTLKFRGTGDVNNFGVSLDNVVLQKA